MAIPAPTVSTPKSSDTDAQSQTAGSTSGHPSETDTSLESGIQSELQLQAPNIPIAAFAFGATQESQTQNIGSSQAGLEQGTPKGHGLLQNGLQSSSLSMGEQNGDAITPEMMHMYHQMRSACKKLIETEGNGAVEAPVERKVLIFGKEVDPDQIVDTCKSFVSMGRTQALRKMAKHRNLK